MDIEAFEALVAEALDSLPEELLEPMENWQVSVEEWPAPRDLIEAGLSPKDRYALLGLYHGVPAIGRDSHYMAFPDHISIYKGPIEAFAGPDEEDIREQVRRTVIHEIAHYWGIDEDRLEELGWD